MNAHSTVRKQFFRYVSQNILGMIGVSAYILAAENYMFRMAVLTAATAVVEET